MYRLSIIVPVFNVENFVINCLNSLYEQNIPNDEFEVIVINDGSTDRSLELVEAFAQTYENMRVYSQTNSGPSAARNYAIKRALGEYLLFVDSDDFLLPEKLNSLLRIAETSKLEVLRADYVTSNEDGIINMKQRRYNNSRYVYTNKIVDGNVLFSEIFCMEFFTPLLLLKRDFILKNRIFFKENIYFEDVDFSTRLSFKVKRAMYVSTIFYVYRLRNKSITHSINPKKLNDLVYVINKLDKWKSTNLSKKVKKSLSQNITHLSTYLFIRLSEPALYRFRKEILSCYSLSSLCIQGGIKDKIVALLYNILRFYCVDFLRPFVALKLKLKGGSKSYK